MLIFKKNINLKAFIAVAVLACLLQAYHIGRPSVPEVWQALLSVVPNRISTEDADFDGTYYVLKQTHEPLFRKDDGQHYSSRLLIRWERDINSRRYVFVPDTRLRFDEGSEFSAKYFSEYIAGVTKKYYPKHSISQSGDSFVVTFPVARAGYLDFLSRYKNAPTVKFSGLIEHGLGPFEAVSIGGGQVELRRKENVRRGYNRIKLFQFTGLNDPRLGDHNVADFNHISRPTQPAWIREEYTPFYNAKLETGNLLINYEDKEIREWLYNCIDVDLFRRAFLPTSSDFLDIRNVLPIGVPGSSAGKALQSCSGKEGAKWFKGPVILADQNPRNLETLRAFAKAFEAKTGRALIIKSYDIRNLIAELSGRKKRGFNLFLCVITSALPDPALFLEYLCGPESYYDVPPPGLLQRYKSLVGEDDPERRATISAELARELTEQHYLLPLYQFYERLYYPRYIKNITIGRDFLEFPEVGDFRW